MATGTKTPVAPRQLGELLKQQQEPFVLEIYLSERGCLRKKKLKYNSIGFGCHGCSVKFLKMNICNKLFAIKGLKTKNSDGENGKVSCVSEMKRNDSETAEPDRFSTASSSTTVYGSCTDSDNMDEPSMIKKALTDSKFQWCSIDDSKEDIPPGEKSLFLSKLIMEDSILWNLLLQATPDKPSCVRELQEPDESNSSPFSISKRVLQQAKKLKEDGLKDCLGSEIVCKKIKDLGKRYGDELSNTAKLQEVDAMGSTWEWNDYEQEKRHVGLVLGNAMGDEIITEVVLDLMFMFHS